MHCFKIENWLMKGTFRPQVNLDHSKGYKAPLRSASCARSTPLRLWPTRPRSPDRQSLAETFHTWRETFGRRRNVRRAGQLDRAGALRRPGGGRRAGGRRQSGARRRRGDSGCRARASRRRRTRAPCQRRPVRLDVESVRPGLQSMTLAISDDPLPSLVSAPASAGESKGAAGSRWSGFSLNAPSGGSLG